MSTRILLIALGVGLVALGVWWFFIRKAPPVFGAPRVYGPGPTAVRQSVVAGAAAAPMAPPIGTPGGGKITVGGALEQGVALAATAGCAAAAGAYTGGAALPLCGLAGPLAVSLGQAGVAGAKAIGSGIATGAKALCFFC
jgi:hypothetical protein